MKYRKKPVVIEAREFSSELAGRHIAEWCGGRYEIERKPSDPSDFSETITIPTLEGNMIANRGDMIIKGVNGEFYPCKPDIFDKTYEQV